MPVITLLILVAMTLATWFFVILPQQRRVRSHEQFVADLQVGDDVVTTAGVFGTVTELSADRVRLRIADGVEITMARPAIGRYQADLVVEPDPTPERPADADRAE